MRSPAGVRLLPLGVLLVLALAGCASSGPSGPLSRSHGYYKIGAPYQINGVWYYPRVDYSYDKTGTASWYGKAFNHQQTANGETFDVNGLSAAHKTLPLPSIVEVTNLKNGRELRLRVNDRGPFVGDRIIDVSRRAAQLLGFERSGTAPVRVKVLKKASIRVAEAAMHGDLGETRVAAAPEAAHLTRLAQAAPPPRPRPAPPVQRVAAAALPPLRLAAPRRAPPPRRTVATAHLSWPSLIASAHAETLYKPARTTGRMAASRPSHRIFVQAGAFAVAANAVKVRDRIAPLGRSEIVPIDRAGTALYRVRLGPVASEAQAERLLRRVVGSGYPGARLVID